MIDKWKKREEKPTADYHIFSVSERTSESPRTGKSHRFFVLHAKDWMNIIALTAENKVVMVRQYRHGIDDITLEIPAGGMEQHDVSPEETARRELLEETGYLANEVTYLGFVHTNPAFFDNRCHTFLATGVEKSGDQGLDETEDIRVEEVDLENVFSLIASGQITHSLTIAAFYLFEQYRREQK